MKFFEKRLPIIISIIAISLSIFTYFQSRKDFNLLNRPQLIMKPIKFEDNSYLKFSSDSYSYYIKILIEVKNNGMTTAHDVKIQPRAILDFFNDVSEHVLLDSTLISIPPGGEIKLETILSFKLDNEEMLNKFISEVHPQLENDFIDVAIPITYRSSFKKDTFYKNYIEFKINKHEVYLTKYLTW